MYPPNSKCTWKITVSTYFKGFGYWKECTLVPFPPGVKIWVLVDA